MVVRSIKGILEMEEVSDETKVGAMRTFFASLDPKFWQKICLILLLAADNGGAL